MSSHQTRSARAKTDCKNNIWNPSNASHAFKRNYPMQLVGLRGWSGRYYPDPTLLCRPSHFWKIVNTPIFDLNTGLNVTSGYLRPLYVSEATHLNPGILFCGRNWAKYGRCRLVSFSWYRSVYRLKTTSIAMFLHSKCISNVKRT